MLILALPHAPSLSSCRVLYFCLLLQLFLLIFVPQRSLLLFLPCVPSMSSSVMFLFLFLSLPSCSFLEFPSCVPSLCSLLLFRPCVPSLRSFLVFPPRAGSLCSGELIIGCPSSSPHHTPLAALMDDADLMRVGGVIKRLEGAVVEVMTAAWIKVTVDSSLTVPTLN